MIGDLRVDSAVLLVILGMSVATYTTKASGLWLLSRVDVSDRVESGLEVLPGAIIVSIVAPELVSGGPAEWSAAAVVLLVMWRTENVLLALLAGVGSVMVLRTML